MDGGLGEAIGNAIINTISKGLANFASSFAQYLVVASYMIALVGGGIMIIMYVAGYKKGFQWVGILLISHALIKYLLG